LKKEPTESEVGKKTTASVQHWLALDEGIDLHRIGLAFHGMDADIFIMLGTFRPAINETGTDENGNLELTGETFDSECDIYRLSDCGIHAAAHGSQRDITDVDAYMAMHLEIALGLERLTNR
jgi:hypothetical protein